MGAYDFQDSYQFTVGAGANGDTLLASLGLGLLDVAGIASGAGGGNYIGSPDLQPVPLPAALPLLLSGLGGLGVWGRRRR